jgi:hypothetical protein
VPRGAGRRWPLLVVCAVACALVVGVVLRAVPSLASWTDAEWAHATVGTSQIRCGTDTNFRSHAEAKAIGGALLTTDLDTFAPARGMDLLRDPASAAVPTPSTATDLGVNDGDPALDTYGSPLAVSALSGVPGLDLTGFAAAVPGAPAGALNQYTQVSTRGQAVAASGLVDSTGAVLVGGGAPVVPLPPPARVDVSSVFPGIANVSATRLAVGAVGSSARLDFCSALSNRIWGPGTVTGITRSYGVAGLTLEVDSPAVTRLVTDVNATVTALNAAVTTASGINGTVGQATSGAMNTVAANISTQLLPQTPTGSVTFGNLNLNVSTALGTLLTAPLTDGLVTVDLANGRVTANLAGLLGSSTTGLNSLPANTRLALDGAAAAAISTRVSALVQTWSTQVTNALLAGVRSTTVTMDVNVLYRVTGVLGTADVARVQVNPSATIGDYLTPPASLTTTVYASTVNALLTGLLNALGLNLSTVVQRLQTEVPPAVVAPVATALRTSFTDRITALGTTLTTSRSTLVTAVGAVTTRMPAALTVAVNVQPDQPGAPAGTVPVPGAPPYTSPTYSVTAIRIGLASAGAPTGFAYLGLGRSTVGPVTQVR